MRYECFSFYGLGKSDEGADTDLCRIFEYLIVLIKSYLSIYAGVLVDCNSFTVTNLGFICTWRMGRKLFKHTRKRYLSLRDSGINVM